MERKLKRLKQPKNMKKSLNSIFEKIYTAPGMNGFVTTHENEKKRRLHKHYLTMHFCENTSFFAKVNSEISIKFTFCYYSPYS